MDHKRKIEKRFYDRFCAQCATSCWKALVKGLLRKCPEYKSLWTVKEVDLLGKDSRPGYWLAGAYQRMLHHSSNHSFFLLSTYEWKTHRLNAKFDCIQSKMNLGQRRCEIKKPSLV